MFGVGDHEVAVEVCLGEVLAEGRHDWWADCEVGDEVAGWGQGYPSMMSTWRDWAPRESICWQSRKRWAKSAERMEGPTTYFLMCPSQTICNNSGRITIIPVASHGAVQYNR